MALPPDIDAIKLFIKTSLAPDELLDNPDIRDLKAAPITIDEPTAIE